MDADFYLEKLRTVQLFRNLSDDNLRQIARRVTGFAANEIIVGKAIRARRY